MIEIVGATRTFSLTIPTIKPGFFTNVSWRFKRSLEKKTLSQTRLVAISRILSPEMPQVKKRLKVRRTQVTCF